MAETPQNGTTTHYGIPLWGPDNYADVEETVNVTATEVDEALHQAVLDAAAAAAAAAQLFTLRAEAAARDASDAADEADGGFLLLGA